MNRDTHLSYKDEWVNECRCPNLIKEHHRGSATYPRESFIINISMEEANTQPVKPYSSPAALKSLANLASSSASLSGITTT